MQHPVLAVTLALYEYAMDRYSIAATQEVPAALELSCPNCDISEADQPHLCCKAVRVGFAQDVRLHDDRFVSGCRGRCEMKGSSART